MASISDLKKDLDFYVGLMSLLEVLKNIAVSQYKVLEKKVKSSDKLTNTINGFMELIDTSRTDHPFLTPRNKTQLILAVTSDSGLMGALNMQVINAAMAELGRTPGKLVVIGERGTAYARENKMPFVSFPGVKEEECFSRAKELRDYLVSRFLDESIGYLKVIFPRPVTFTVQRIETISFLPFRQELPPAAEASQGPIDMIVESSPADSVEYLVFLLMEQKLSEVFLLSRLSEYAARFVHLEGSAQRLKDLEKKLRMQYFRLRHEVVDRNMRELFAAKLLYANSD